MGKLALLGILGVVVAGIGWFVLRHSGGGGDGDDHALMFLVDGISQTQMTMKYVNERGSVIHSEVIYLDETKNSNQWTPDRSSKSDPFNLSWGTTLVNTKKQVMLIDRFGKKTIDPPGIPTSDFNEGMAPAKANPPSQNGLCGYLNRDHRMAVPAEYEECLKFVDGLAEVRLGRKWGYVNTAGKLQIPAQFLSTCRFSEGLAHVQLPEGWAYVDQQGKVVFKAEATGCADFNGGLAAARQGPKVGYVDRAGKFVIPAKYDSGGEFHDGRAWVRREGQLRLIDRSGNEIALPAIARCENFHRGLAPVQADGKWGLLDTNGKFAVQPKYTSIGPVVSGLRQTEAPPGYMDEHGAEVKPPGPVCPSYNHGVFTCFGVRDPNAAQNLFFLMAAGGLKSIDYYGRSGSLIGRIDVEAISKLGDKAKGKLP